MHIISLWWWSNRSKTKTASKTAFYLKVSYKVRLVGHWRGKVDQLFLFNGQQTDGVPMGSTLGPQLTNVFTCGVEKKKTLEREGKMPTYYMASSVNRFLRCDWLPARARWLYLFSFFAVSCRKIVFSFHRINPLLFKPSLFGQDR